MTKRPFVFILTLGVAVVGAGLSAIEGTTAGRSAANVSAQQAQKNVWERVYTEAQATRGQETYQQKCAACHLENLEGDGIAPALIGSAFFTRWSTMTVSDLFTTVSTAMPQDEPGSLTPQVYADVISYLIKRNEIPAGDAELPPDTEKLKGIVITEKPAQ